MYKIYEQLRDEKGVTDSEVCRATGLTSSTISNWKAGRYSPKADKLLKLARYFDVSVEKLIGEQ